ncbi:sigma-70 family RNA polymerase sigma factor [Echinicola marina]|uniref:RNA polymerase sigma factor n=1 Tax=Echinicola marina TaxID=2859768 RepID=UPI001CF64EB6|nr:sigma-70 family RNA polymerase sigma factor [Echinicola marina]UCS91800.1 sigma-70 family RNA polymerase sigma factor [Echinicola marina]
MIPSKEIETFSISDSKYAKEMDAAAHAEQESGIWREFQQGSELALAKIFKLYAHNLFNYGRQITAHEDLVNDAIQDVFYQLIKSKHKISTANSIKYYLFSSFRRRLMRLLKQKRKMICEENIEKEGQFLMSIDPDYHSIQTMFTLDQKKVLEEACNQLPVRQREILSLYFFEGLSYKEIASVMDFSQVKSARKLLYRALDSLNTRLHKHKDILRILFVFVA